MPSVRHIFDGVRDDGLLTVTFERIGERFAVVLGGNTIGQHVLHIEYLYVKPMVEGDKTNNALDLPQIHFDASVAQVFDDIRRAIRDHASCLADMSLSWLDKLCEIFPEITYPKFSSLYSHEYKRSKIKTLNPRDPTKTYIHINKMYTDTLLHVLVIAVDHNYVDLVHVLARTRNIQRDVLGCFLGRSQTVDMAKTLIHNGADPNNMTTLFYAFGWASLDVLQFLLTHVAPIDNQILTDVYAKAALYKSKAHETASVQIEKLRVLMSLGWNVHDSKMIRELAKEMKAEAEMYDLKWECNEEMWNLLLEAGCIKKDIQHTADDEARIAKKMKRSTPCHI